MDTSTRQSLLTGGGLAVDSLSPTELADWMIAASNAFSSLSQHVAGFTSLAELAGGWRVRPERNWAGITIKRNDVVTHYPDPSWRCLPLNCMSWHFTDPTDTQPRSVTIRQLLWTDYYAGDVSRSHILQWEVKGQSTPSGYIVAVSSEITWLHRQALVELVTTDRHLACDFVDVLVSQVALTIKKREQWLQSLREQQQQLANIDARVNRPID